MYPYYVIFMLVVLSILAMVLSASVTGSIHQLQDQILGFLQWFLHI